MKDKGKKELVSEIKEGRNKEKINSEETKKRKKNVDGKLIRRSAEKEERKGK